MLHIDRAENDFIIGLRQTSDEGDVSYSFHDNDWRMGVHLEMQTNVLDLNTSVHVSDDYLEIIVEAINPGVEPALCKRLRFLSGLDMLMLQYPDYLNKFMPTALRTENDHFWSLFGTPSGKWLALVSPDTVESFEIIYDDRFASVRRGIVKSGGHQIMTVALDLICAEDPRPQRMGESLNVFEPGEKRIWRLRYIPLKRPDDIGIAVVRYSHAPYLQWQRSGAKPGCAAIGKLFIPADEQFDTEMRWGARDLQLCASGRQRLLNDVDEIPFVMEFPKGHDLRGKDAEFIMRAAGKALSASAYFFDDWTSYVHCAASVASRRHPPEATKVCEASMPMFSLLAAQRIAPTEPRKQLILGFLENELFQAVYSPEGEPRMNPDRIQNHSCTIDLCREAWHAGLGETWLQKAMNLAEVLFKCQGNDGGFYAHGGSQHYTCVIYIAKSLLDLAETLVSAATTASTQTQANRYIDFSKRLQISVSHALDDLLSRGEDIGTEGAPCYEDGAIACAALQLAQWSMKTGDPRYARLSEKLMQGHACLEWKSPQAVANGATIRFWESFWAVGWNNCLNTPHGWSAWTGLAWHNLYLATGNPDYLDRFISNLCACLHLVNTRQGDLFFCYSPQMNVLNASNRMIVGESFLPFAQPGEMEEGGSETHEVIKLLTETVLSNAYLYWRDGRWQAFNISLLSSEDGRLKPYSDGQSIKNIYLNTAGIEQNAITATLDLSTFPGTVINHGTRQ